jgi:hypothetical protein
LCEGDRLLDAIGAADMATLSEGASVVRFFVLRIRKRTDFARLDALRSLSDALVFLLQIVKLLAHVGILPRQILHSPFQFFQSRAVQAFALTSVAGADAARVRTYDNMTRVRHSSWQRVFELAHSPQSTSR